MLKPIGPHWKRRARTIREKIRTADDGNMDKAGKSSGLPGILGAMFRTLLAILSSFFDLLSFNPTTASSQLVATAMTPNAGQKDHRKELSEETKEIVKSMDDKLNCLAHFRYEIRLVVEKDGVTFHDIDRIAAAFRSYDKHNGLVHNRSYPPSSWVLDRLTRYNLWPIFGSSSIISSDELAGLVHNPYKTAVLVKMDMNTSRSAPAPPAFTEVDANRVFLGTNHHRLADETISVPWEDFRLHGLVVGTTGCGKNTLLKSILRQWIDSDPDNPRGALFIEPHGDACHELLDSIPERHIDRVYNIDPGDEDFPLAFNPLAYADVFTSARTTDAIIAGFHAIWDLDPSMANLMMYLPRVVSVLARVQGAHFGWIRPFVTIKEFRELVLNVLGDPEATEFWRHYGTKAPRLRDEEVRSLLNRVDQFVLDPRLRGVFCQPRAKVDFEKILDEGKIVICHFGDMNAGPIGKRLLGNLFCSYIHQAAQVRDPERRPFLICMDECSEYLTPTLASILAQDRKFGITFLAAFQYLAQTEDLLAGLKGNTNTRISFNVGEEDAVALAPLFTSSSDPEEVRRRADDLMNLERFQGFLKATVNGRPLPPTTFSLSPPNNIVHWANRELVSAATRRDLCQRYEEVCACHDLSTDYITEAKLEKAVGDNEDIEEGKIR
jgi:hypothetical protein